MADNSDLTINSNRLAATTSTASGNISIAKNINGVSDEDLTITTTANGAGTISLGPIGATGYSASGKSEINTFTVTGAGAITLNGAITTSEAADNDVSITGNVILTSNGGTITTNDTNDGDVTISGSVIGTHGTDQDLIIDSGAGAVSIGSIGTVSENTH